MQSDYRPGDRVIVVKGNNRTFRGEVIGPNPKNTAEYEVTAEDGKVWCVHWAYLKIVHIN